MLTVSWARAGFEETPTEAEDPPPVAFAAVVEDMTDAEGGREEEEEEATEAIKGEKREREKGGILGHQ